MQNCALSHIMVQNPSKWLHEPSWPASEHVLRNRTASSSLAGWVYHEKLLYKSMYNNPIPPFYMYTYVCVYMYVYTYNLCIYICNLYMFIHMNIYIYTYIFTYILPPLDDPNSWRNPIHSTWISIVLFFLEQGVSGISTFVFGHSEGIFGASKLWLTLINWGIFRWSCQMFRKSSWKTEFGCWVFACCPKLRPSLAAPEFRWILFFSCHKFSFPDSCGLDLFDTKSQSWHKISYNKSSSPENLQISKWTSY